MENLAIKKKSIWKIILFILLGIVILFFLLQIAKNTLPKLLDSLGRNNTSQSEFPQTLSEQKNYIYDYFVNKGQDKELAYLGYDKPTTTELAEKKSSTDLSQNYPEFIKGIFDPGGDSNTLSVKYFSDELKELGINTYFVIGEYQINHSKATLFMPYISKKGSQSKLTDQEGKEILIDRILIAKTNKLSTILVPDYPEVFDIGRANYDITKIDPELKRVALELAAIAQEYGVEYFAPVNEYEHLLFSNGYSISEIKTLFSSFYNDLIPQIRQVYKGKIIIKCGNVGNWDNFSNLSVKGADLFGVGNAYAPAKGEVKEDVADMVKAAAEVSQRDGVPWFVSEFLVFNPEDQVEMMGEVKAGISTDEAYQEATESFLSNTTGASGFSFMSWLGTGKIRNTEAAKTMKNFFANY